MKDLSVQLPQLPIRMSDGHSGTAAAANQKSKRESKKMHPDSGASVLEMKFNGNRKEPE